jgi:hypothetical protein
MGSSDQLQAPFYEKAYNPLGDSGIHDWLILEWKPSLHGISPFFNKALRKINQIALMLQLICIAKNRILLLCKSIE